MKCKLAIVGLDGCNYEFIKKWSSRGELRFFKKIIDEGCHGHLQTVVPIHSVPAWTSFATGRYPVHHGVFDVMVKKGSRWILPTLAMARSPSFWRIASDKGFRVGIFNVPVMYPPTKVNGVSICGWVAPSNSIYAFPIELYKYLRELNYKLIVDERVRNLSLYIKDVFKTTLQHIKVFLNLLEKEGFDLVVIVLFETEALHHKLAAYMDKKHPFYNEHLERILLYMYKMIDKLLIGKLLSYSDNVIVVSDHGHAPMYGRVLVNELLKREGFLRVKNTGLAKILVSRILRGLKTFISVPNGTNRADRFFLKIIYPLVSFLKSRYSELLGYIDLESILDMNNTVAYVPFTHGSIYLNPRIIKLLSKKLSVSEEKVAKALTRVLIKRLSSTYHTLGISFIASDELYPDYKYIDISCRPAVFILFGEKVFQIDVDVYTGKTFVDASKAFNLPADNIGYHTINGIFLAYGKAFERGVTIRDGEVRIVDIAPLAMLLLGVEDFENIDGRVPEKLLSRWELREKALRVNKILETRSVLKEKIRRIKKKSLRKQKCTM